ncbi:MAG: type II secretion system protein [bacterium]
MNRCPGFTLIEVVIAIVILVSSVFVLNDLQIKSLFHIMKDREEIERIFLVKQFVYKACLYPEQVTKRVVTKFDDPGVPELTVVTESPEIAVKSELYKLKDLVKIFYADGTWKSSAGTRQMKMITLLRKEPDANKKQK